MKYLIALFAIVGLLVISTPSFADKVSDICNTEASKEGESVSADKVKITVHGVEIEVSKAEAEAINKAQASQE